MSTFQVYARGFLADVVAGGPIKPSIAVTVGDVVGELRAKLVTAFNHNLQLGETNCLNPSMCSTFTFLAADPDSKLADIFPGQDEASLFVFVVPPQNFIRSRLQDQIQEVQAEIQEMKKQDVWAQKQIVWAQKQKEFEQRQTAQEFRNLRSEIASLRQAHHSLNLQIILDTARRKVLDVLYDEDPEMSWGQLRNQFPDSKSLYDWLCSTLQFVNYCPSNQALRLLCQHSTLRVAGDDVAHHGNKDELALAISKYDGPNKAELILLFEFAFEESFYIRF